jgi:hypothetical protein
LANLQKSSTLPAECEALDTRIQLCEVAILLQPEAVKSAKKVELINRLTFMSSRCTVQLPYDTSFALVARAAHEALTAAELDERGVNEFVNIVKPTDAGEIGHFNPLSPLFRSALACYMDASLNGDSDVDDDDQLDKQQQCDASGGGGGAGEFRSLRKKATAEARCFCVWFVGLA